ncbi:MAG: hypothetical protein JO223_05800 [Hyphomicrobiales bacterium]|nr:hypothetical protein [Hyphomicrobiales bacterium]
MTQVLPCLGAEPGSVIRRTKNLLFYGKRDLTHGVVGQLPFKPIITLIRGRLNFPVATYNTIITYDFHQKLQKKAPERLKNLERLRILIYFCHNSCRRGRRSTWGVDSHPDPFAIPRMSA